mgnify:CR=1 FL=1
MKELTPKQAWEQYCGEDIEFFVSLFKADEINDITEMCRIYAQDIPVLFEKLFDQDQLNKIANLMEQHINEVGYDENKLLSKEELDKMWEEEAKAIISLVKKNW